MPDPNLGIEIANIALTAHLGAKPLVSFDEADDPSGPDRARVMKMLYPAVRDELLSIQPWHFATTRATLAELATPPVYGWSRAYQLPQGGNPVNPGDPVPPPFCLRVLDTNLDPSWGLWWDTWPGWLPGTWPWPQQGREGLWQIEGRTLGSWEANLAIRYVARVEDPTVYTPTFAAALAATLAERACYSITQNAELRKLLIQEAEALVKRARAVEGQEGSQLQYSNTALTWDVR
jgi:hypothetical protein